MSVIAALFRLSLSAAPIMPGDVIDATTLHYTNGVSDYMLAGPWSPGPADVYFDGSALCVGSCAGEYVGAINVAANGKLSCVQSYALAPRCDISNAYNREPLILQGGNPDSVPSCSWVGTRYFEPSSVYPDYDHVCGIAVTIFSARADQRVEIVYSQLARVEASSIASAQLYTGVGIDGLTRVGVLGVLDLEALSNAYAATIEARYVAAPFAGAHVVWPLMSRSANGAEWGGWTQPDNQLVTVRMLY